MFDISDTAKALIRNVVIYCFIILIIFALFSYNDIDSIIVFGTGLLFGALLVIFKIVLLEKNIKKAVEFNESRANNYMRLHFLARYVLTGVVLLVAGLNPRVGLMGTVLALFTLHISAYTINMPFFKKIKNRFKL